LDVLNLFYLIGVYDPTADDSWPWPWHCHYEDGRYLSAKHRVCGKGRAAEFASEDEARAFYFNWTHSLKYKFELIPVRFWTYEPDPPFPPEHPKSILRSIQDNEPYSIDIIRINILIQLLQVCAILISFSQHNLAILQV